MKTRNPFTIIRFAKLFISLTKNPGNLDMVFQISDSVDKSEILKTYVDHISKYPTGPQALESKHRLGAVDLASLEALPEGTLGQVFASHMKAHNLRLEDIPTKDADSQGEYVIAHLYETHDIWHVVTGFRTDIAGELGLQAFYLAQFPGVLSSVLLAAGLLNTAILQMDDRENRMNSIVRGWQLGRQARPLFGYRWDLAWEKSIAEVRTELTLAA